MAMNIIRKQRRLKSRSTIQRLFILMLFMGTISLVTCFSIAPKPYKTLLKATTMNMIPSSTHRDDKVPNDEALLSSDVSKNHCTTESSLSSSSFIMDRRSVTTSSISLVASVWGLTSGFFSMETSALAADTSSKFQTLISRLRRVPTFAIVDSKTGIPYMLVQRSEGMAKGYAFTSYDGAKIVLEDAQNNAKEKNDQPMIDLWKDATVTYVPGDTAMKLVLQKRKRKPQEEKRNIIASLESVMEWIPTASDREDALRLDNSRAFVDQGHVPLFYSPELTLPSKDDDSLPLTPMYFTKQDFINEWNRQHPTTSTDEDNYLKNLQVVDLIYVIEGVLRGYENKFPSNMVFIPSKESVNEAKDLISKGQVLPYKLDDMLI